MDIDNSREFTELTGGEWHVISRDEPEDYYSDILEQNCIAYKCTCGELFAVTEGDTVTECVTPNPDYTNPVDIRTAMGERWYKFIIWLWHEYRTMREFADILTDPKLLLSAAISYMKSQEVE